MSGWRQRHATVRVKLTAACTGLLLLAGAALDTLVYVLLRQSLPSGIVRTTRGFAASQGGTLPNRTTIVPPGQLCTTPFMLGTKLKLINVLTGVTLSRLLVVSIIALAIFTLGSIPLAWWFSGRILRPVHAVTAAARRLSADNLHERIALQGPPDELKELADTFDQMLDRLEGMVAAQQRFVANAAHELRTPLTLQRTTAELGLADPTPRQVQQVRSDLLAIADRSEHLIESLLLLSISDQGLEHPDNVRLDHIVESVTTESAAAAEAAKISVHLAVDATHLRGDAVLLTHLVRNLLSNAIRYNQAGGQVKVRVQAGMLQVTNTGPVVPATAVPHLFEPFRRAQLRHHASGEGAGLGLSIATSIARAHDATITARANSRGGLTVNVAFPAS